MVRRAAPLEENRLRGSEDRPRPLKTAQRNIVIELMPRGHGIDGHEHRPPRSEQIERCLADADMGFESAEDHRDCFFKRRLRRRDATDAKGHFCDRWRQQRQERGGGGPESLGVLFGEQAADVEDPRRFRQPSDSGDDAGGIGEDRQKAFLDVDHAQQRAGGGDAHGGLAADVEGKPGSVAVNEEWPTRRLVGMEGNRLSPPRRRRREPRPPPPVFTTMAGHQLRIVTRRLDGQRRLVGDIVRLSHRVPIFPVDRVMQLGELEALRRAAVPRIGWAAVFMKAYALVARERPALRSWFVPWRIVTPWRRPRWATSPISVASLALSRPRASDGHTVPEADLALDPDAIWWARIREPDARSLPELQAAVLHHMTAPVGEVFARQLELAMLPGLLRRLILRWNAHAPSPKRALRVGTFSLSTLAGEGCANRMHPTFLTSSLTYTPLDSQGRMTVTLLADHRLLDGVPVARALAELEAVLHGPIAAELAALRGAAPAESVD